MNVTREQVFEWLEEVKDPEIPVLSLVDLGVITGVDIKGASIEVELTPTFVGCPALDMMKQDISDVLVRRGFTSVIINTSFREPWSSDKISEKGRLALKKFGLAPPPSAASLIDDLSILEHAVCPRCNSNQTELRSSFGATLCRSIHYCNHCQEAFERFKPL